jgi:hypothetical protein
LLIYNYKGKTFFQYYNYLYKNMENNLNDILFLMDKFTSSRSSELEEQGDDAAPTGGGGGYPAVTKWETGLVRSNANTIDDKVTWKSLNKLVRGKANTLL